MLLLKPDSSLKDEFIKHLDRKGPFVTHGKDLFVKYDSMELRTWPATIGDGFIIGIVFKYQDKKVASTQTNELNPGDTVSINMGGMAGDIELPLSFV